MSQIDRRAVLRRCWRPALALAALGLVLLSPFAAHAASTGALPWDTPLQTLKTDITGPVAFTISLLAMVACGGMLIFGGEINEFVRRIIMIVIVAAFLVGVTNVASALGITGAVV